MKTVYLRGISDELHAELENVARIAGLSVNRVANAILARQLGQPHPHTDHVARAIIRAKRTAPDQLPME